MPQPIEELAERDRRLERVRIIREEIEPWGYVVMLDEDYQRLLRTIEDSTRTEYDNYL